MNWFRRSGAVRQPALDLAMLDPNRLPILRCSELLDLLEQHNRIRTIRRLAGTDPGRFDELYQPALDRFLEAAQLQPASAADHHSCLGGLIAHTLEVIETALRYRKQYMLPQYAGPERIAAEEHVWTYAVFAGALLHDAGKMLTLTRLHLDNDRPWTPHGPALRETGAECYSIVFLQTPYVLQTRVNNSLYHLLPATGRDLLAQNSEVMTQLTAWLYGDAYEWGVIGDIIRQADGESVANNLGAGGGRKRLPNAPSVPMVERMMRALRQCIYDGELKFNRSGAAGWVEGEYTYLVCGVAATKVLERLRQEGSTDVPSDNVRLFDIWQDHGYAIATEDDRAIWNMTVIGDGYRHDLSMLKFETGRLFHPSRRPDLFHGKLLQSTGTDVDIVNDAQIETPETASDSRSAALESSNLPQLADAAKTPETAPVGNSKGSNKPAADDNPQEIHAADKQGAAPVDVSAEAAKSGGTPTSLKDPAIGQHFLAWLRAGLRDKGLKVNRKEAMVHIVPEGVLLVTPAIFKAYLQHYGMASTDKNELDKQFRRVQSRVQKLRMHRRTRSKMNIFKYKVQGPNFSSAIRGWLFPASTIYGEQTPPAPNELLEIVSELDPDS